MHMGKTCGTLASLGLAIAGLVFLAYGLNLGWTDGMSTHVIGGLLILFYGIAKLVHIMEMCPSCNAEHGSGMMKKR